MTATPEGFILTPVKNRTVSGLVGSKTIGLVLHVQAGNGALGGWFSNPAAEASSTWWAGKKGQREQYGNPDTDRFWAQSAGNSAYHSIETEGYPNEPLTAAQIESVAVAFAWGHERYGWPLVLAEKPGQPGLGWHGMGGTAWGGHTGCPGDIRKAQRAQILERAKQIAAPPAPTLEDIMADLTIKNPATGDDASAESAFASIWWYAFNAFRNVTALQAQVAALGEVVNQLASKGSGSIDMAAVQKASEAAVRNVLGSVDNPPA